ncbi:MAG TPA: histidinol dehydrogenase [Gaiellales bacterium]|nr:histidinol dehydrogenase [Gaiellales bacterium]
MRERRRVAAAEVDGLVRALRPSKALREDVSSTVADIVDMVRNGGDEAVRRLTSRLDGVDVEHMRVKPARLREALDDLAPDVRAALELLAENLRLVAEDKMPQATRVTLRHGQVVSTRQVPVRRVGVYVPGGLAAYPSSAVMAIVPAQVAGVPEIAACSPPGPSGLPDAGALAVCALLGVDEVYAAGGAQAVAALALGTASIPAVDMVVGPGNAYVEEAKRRLFGEVGIESLAGPTELVVVADATAPAEAAAVDLLAQVEHGPGAQSVLVSADPGVLAAIEPFLPDQSGVIVVEADTLDTALGFVNAYAPEHLQLMVSDPGAALEAVHHAGAIFIGPHSGTAYGDYIAGSNHILPTGGHSRFSSGLSPTAFLRTQEVVELSEAAAAALAAPLAALARAEGFVDHARSGEIRGALAADAAPPAPAVPTE